MFPVNDLQPGDKKVRNWITSQMNGTLDRKVSLKSLFIRMPRSAGSWDAQKKPWKQKISKNTETNFRFDLLAVIRFFTVWPFFQAMNMIFQAENLRRFPIKFLRQVPDVLGPDRTFEVPVRVDTQKVSHVIMGSVQKCRDIERYQPSIFQVLAVKFLGCSGYTAVFHIPWPGLWALKSLLRPLIRAPNAS